MSGLQTTSASQRIADWLALLHLRRKLRRSGGILGRRVEVYDPRFIDLDDGCVIEDHVLLRGGEREGYSLSIGAGTTVRRNATISARRTRVVIGRGGHFASNVWIAGRGPITIGDFALIAPNVVIISSNHDFENRDPARRKNQETPGPIRIGTNVWIGAGSTVLPNVTIGDNAVVGAGSVVTSDIPPNAVAYGNPARVRRELSLEGEGVGVL